MLHSKVQGFLKSERLLRSGWVCFIYHIVPFTSEARTFVSSSNDDRKKMRIEVRWVKDKRHPAYLSGSAFRK